MSAPLKSLSSGLRVFETLIGDDFQGRTVREIRKETGLDSQAVRRALATLKEMLWALDVPVSGSKEARWVVTPRLAEIAHAYERGAVRKIQTIKNEFRETAGRELEA